MSFHVTARIVFAVVATVFFSGAGQFDGAAPITIETRETALAATIDLEFQDAMKSDVSGSVILEQDDQVALRAGYGFADLAKTTPFTAKARVPTGVMAAAPGEAGWISSSEDVYRWFRSEPFDRAARTSGPWDIRRAADGHVVQVSLKRQSGTFLSYFCWRPDDKVFLYFIANGGEKEDAALLNRIMTSVRDAGTMPVTNMH
jgi:hypothetical protein